jgi:hypothetical protein
MEQQPTEEQLQKWGEKITKSLHGFTKDDLEPLFEKYVLPIYVFVARKHDQESKWKIVNRETEEEYPLKKATTEFKKLFNLKF